MPEEHLFQDGTLSFLPTRLNRQPVVIGGPDRRRNVDHGLHQRSSRFVLGIPAALVAGNAACIPLGALLVGALGLGIGSRVLRRMKRGGPISGSTARWSWPSRCAFPSSAIVTW
nr:DUF3487 family protein [Pseudomonas aeruginosa]